MRFVTTWITLALFWVMLSGTHELSEPIPLFWALVSVTFVAAISKRHLTQGVAYGDWAWRLLTLPPYTAWLMWEIAKANVDVILRVVGVREINPRMIRYRPEMLTDFGQVILANSITLTPGTVTVDIEKNGDFIIHAISPEAAEGVLSRDMERQVRRLELSPGRRRALAPAKKMLPPATPVLRAPTPALAEPIHQDAPAPGPSGGDS